MQKLILYNLLKQRTNLNAELHRNINQTAKYRLNDSMTSLVLDIGKLSDKYETRFHLLSEKTYLMHMLTKFI